MGQIPLLPALREGGDTGVPIVLSQPEAPASIALREAAHQVARATKTKIGKPLNLMTNAGRRRAGASALVLGTPLRGHGGVIAVPVGFVALLLVCGEGLGVEGPPDEHAR